MNYSSSPKRPRGRPTKHGCNYADTKEVLIHRGIELLTERGMNAMSLDDLMKSVQVPKGSFYHYFVNKEAFILEVLDAYELYFVKRLNKFLSQTDTEVIVHLFEEYNKSAKTPFDAYKKTISRLKGAYATLLITKAAPGELFFAKNAAPLIIARDADEFYLSSSDSPLIGLAKDAIYLEDGTYGVVKLGSLNIYDENDK